MSMEEMTITEINEVLEWAANLAGISSIFHPRHNCISEDHVGGHEIVADENCDLDTDDNASYDDESSIGSYEAYMMDQLGMSWKDFY